ncbi:MAG: filamentous hemagglutinin N-terminal domain-containing protein [Methylocystis sp.]
MSWITNYDLEKNPLKWESLYRAANVVESVAKPARLSLLFLTGVGALLPLHSSLAGPQGGVVVSGQANISANGSTTNINQSSNQAIINWQLFSIAPQETVNFNQPGPTSVTLNRVIGNEKSVIEGALNANGQVFIVNSAGVVFTKSAQVNVGGLVASTLDISNGNFLAGKYQFSGNSTASVVNLGNIQANPGGYVALLGNTVSNQGAITATLGTVAMASGNQVTLNLGGNALVDVTTDKGTLNALVENKGAIIADGGKVILTARAADALLSAQVNNTGVIQARTMAGLTGGQTRTGSIKLLATGGKVNVAGRLDASAPNGGNGGTIETSGAKVSVANDAVITTDAPSGKKGLWLLDPDGFTIAASGGDITGVALGNELNNNNVTILSTQGSGTDGGVHVNDAVTWSANTTLTLNATNSITITAPITALGAGAGLTLNAGIDVNVNAVNALNVATINGSIGNNLNIQAAQTWTTPPDLTGLAVTGNVNVNAPLTWSTGALTLASTNSINVNAPITATDAAASLTLNTLVNVNVNAANALNVATIGGTINSINIQQAQTWTTPPDFSGLAVTNSVNVNAPLTWSSGALALNATNSINVNASITGTGAAASLVLTTGDSINVNAPIAASGAAASVTLNAADIINIAAPITATDAASILTLNAGVDVNVTAANALNAATINGLVGNNFNIQQSQGWTTPPDFSGLTVANNVNVNGAMTWSTGALTLAATNNVNVNAPINWSTGTLTLNAGQNVDVNAVMTASGTANFVANYGTASGVNPDGTPFGLYTGLASTGAYAGRIDFSGSGAVTLNSQNYMVINSKAGLDALGSNPSGNYVLGSDIAISTLAEIPTFTGNYNGFGHALPVASVSTLSVNAPLSIPSLQNTNVVLNSSGDISINAPVTSGAGVLTFNAGGAINLNASLQSANNSFGSFAFAGKGMTVETTSSVSGANVFLNAPTSWSSNATLTLAATDSIYINSSITATGANAGLTLNYGADYVFNNASTTITLSGANPSLTINGNAYQVITTLAQLAAISPNANVTANGFYALGGDINAGGVAFTGPVINDLEGTLAGFNHKISNLTIIDPAFSYNDALIATVGMNTGLAAVVRDIGLVNVNVNALSSDSMSGAPVAALVNTNFGTISNAYAYGGSVSGYSAGGLVNSSYGNISNSWTWLSVSGVFEAGGLAAANYGNINNSYANGPVSAVGATSADGGLQGAGYLGGLVGYNTGNITNSHATGTVTATDLGVSIGGLVGENNNFFGTPGQGIISNSYATGNVNVTVTNVNAATQGIGGLVGTNTGGFVLGSSASGNVTVAATNPNGFAQDVGGLVGLNQSSFAGTGGVIDHSSASGAVAGNVGTVFSLGGLVGSNADPFTSITNSSASGFVSVGEYPNAPYNAGGLIGNAAAGATYGGNTYSISGTGQTSATGLGSGGDAAVGATGTNPPPAGSSTAPNFTAPTQPFIEQTSAANVVATVDTTYSAASPPRPRVAASAGTAKTSALAGPSFSDIVSTPTNQTEGEWLQKKQATDAANTRAERARAASLSPPSRSTAAPEAKEAPPPHRHAFTPAPRPAAKPKGAGFGATIHSIEIEGKQYELHDKPGNKPEAPETKPQAPESKPQAPEAKPQAPENTPQAPSDHK